LVREARRRREIFGNLEAYLRRIAEVVRGLDPQAELYLFGSVAEGTHTYSSDIDILVVTRAKPAEVRAALWRHGIEDPFQIHVATPKEALIYKRRAALKPISDA